MVEFFLNPTTHQFDDALLFFSGQRSARWNVMPFGQTSTAAAAGGMLRFKDRMTAPWCLLAVIGNNGRSQTLSDKAASVRPDDGRPLLQGIGTVLRAKMNARAEFRVGKPLEVRLYPIRKLTLFLHDYFFAARSSSQVWKYFQAKATQTGPKAAQTTPSNRIFDRLFLIKGRLPKR